MITFRFFRGIAKKAAPFFVNGATFLQIPKEIIPCPLTTTLEVNQYTLEKDQRVLARGVPRGGCSGCTCISPSQPERLVMRKDEAVGNKKNIIKIFL
jgi:hypothetical protein